MIGQHIRDRFFQRYGLELTVEIIRELRTACLKSKIREPDPVKPGVEHVTIHWRGADILTVWHGACRTIITFLPPKRRMDRIAWCLPKKKKHVHGTPHKKRSKKPWFL